MTQPDLAQTELDDAPPSAAPSAEALREQMVKELIEEGELDDPAIQSAFRAVPRDVFAPPGTPTELAYAVHDALRTRFSVDGRALSSLSAPFMQAGNLRQSRVEPGMRVLEIGSGGPNAAMLAHLVGPDGEVVTVDIDESVTARTTAGLERLGLTDRVEVITADAGRHLGRGVFDRIMVTVSPWTIPQVWLEQLAPDGVLVVPLQIAPGLQRIIGFRYQDGHLISESTVPGGFVPLQGANRYEPPAVELTGPSGNLVTFRFADQIPDDFAVTDDVLAAAHAEAWSGVIYPSRTIWLDLLTWVLIQPGGCSMEAKEPTDRGTEKSFYPAITEQGSFAALAWRPLCDGNDLEIGAVGKGPVAGALTTRLAEAIRTYGAEHRAFDPIFEWWPDGAAQIPHPARRLSRVPTGH
jgi:protein-L-isoaspartate(D-aspartate) O-methyltransferase